VYPNLIINSCRFARPREEKIQKNILEFLRDQVNKMNLL
jgi:hypothetical protein